jgi:hypothetical protein
MMSLILIKSLFRGGSHDPGIRKSVDCSPFIVEGDMPIETVSKEAMTREQLKLYDLIIVAKNQIFKGVVSVQTILDTMTRIRLEMAKGANPWQYRHRTADAKARV